MSTAFSLLVFGQNGQLARALARECGLLNIQAAFIGSGELNLATNPFHVRDIIAASNADVIINAAAYTQVDKAESEAVMANALNSLAPTAMARACKDTGKAFIHLSTDYVFKGDSDISYKPDDRVDPLNAYGVSKAEGEMAICALGGRSVILRTSWLYDGAGANFLNTMRRLAAKQTVVTVVDDQIGRPTYAGHLAQACMNIAQALANREILDDIYHVTSSGTPISWADFARAIFKASNVNCAVKNIPTQDYPTPAPRPAYSVLDISGYEQRFGPLPDWQNGLKQALCE